MSDTNNGRPVPWNTNPCLAQEWQRNGRGLWAMRACQYYTGHQKPHTFGPWRYNVQPPSDVESAKSVERKEDASETGTDRQV